MPSQSYPERRDWPLVVRRAEALPARRNGKVLLVRTVSAAPELEARGLQWLRPDGSVHVDYYEQWAVPPAQAVDDDLRQWLAASGIYAAVLAPGSRLNADLVLEGELETFVADVPAGMARARLAVVLLDQQPNPAKVKLQQTFGGDCAAFRRQYSGAGGCAACRAAGRAAAGRAGAQDGVAATRHHLGQPLVRSASWSGVSVRGPSPSSGGWSGRLAGSRQQSATPRLRVQ